MPPARRAEKSGTGGSGKRAGGTAPPSDDGAGSEAAGLPAAHASKHSAASAEAAVEDGGDGGEAEDFGGLMNVIKTAGKKVKKDKKKRSAIPALSDNEDSPFARSTEPHKHSDPDPDPDGERGGAEILDGDAVAKPRGIIEASAEDLFPEDEPKKKAGKKGKKGKKGKAEEEEEDEDALLEAMRKKREAEVAAAAAERAATAPPPPPAADGDDGAEEGDAGPGRVLSKKEKEKLKKEKEKAKKKAQAAAKKAAGGEAEKPASTGPASTAAEGAGGDAAEEAEEGGEGDDEPGTAGSKNKKKKKKKGAAAGAAKEEPPPPSSEPTKKKIGGKLNALRAAMEEKQRLEALARAKAEEEERLRQEEEERAEAEEKRKEEERQRKKEKEKAKKEELRKAGKLLTPKQKAEKAAAEARLAALVASGVQVAGLAERSGGGPPGSSGTSGAKKPAYGKKPQKGARRDPLAAKAEEVQKVGAAKEVESRDDNTVPQEATAEPKVKVAEAKVYRGKEPEPEPEEEQEDGIKDSWDAESDDVKDDWEAESEEEKATEKAVSTPASASGKASAKSAQAPKGAPANAAQPPPKAVAAPAKATNGKPRAPPAEESSEEETSEEDSDEDSEEDSDGDDDDSDEDSEEEEDPRQARRERAAAQKKAEAAARRKARFEEAKAAGKTEDMRSPICCILGHVDTGKTKLLDKIRQTNVQEGEAGGITQQIGATFFPMESIKAKTRVLAEHDLAEYKLPGLLVIDTPGHESFTNLRSRGSSLCNIAILVVDIMHGLEPQTLESLRLLRERRAPFIVALNKIDRIYGWQATRDNAFRSSLAGQVRPVQREFENRLQQIRTAFQEQGLNAEPYYTNTNFSKNVSIVPTSAITGEGVPDLLMLLIKLTQERMTKDLMYLSEIECTVLEVKVIEGLGTTIDVVLSNGVLREGDRIVLCGLNGPIVTQIRALLTPQPLKELRIKGSYVHHKEVKAALGIKITAPDLEKAIAGSRLLLLTDEDDEEDLKEEVMGDLSNLMNSIDKSGRGVCVQASTLGSLEALLDFLKSSKIPVSGINIGPVYKRDIMRAGTMLEKAKELAVILAFDVPIDKDAEKLADETGVKVFKADIIYHLFDAFTAYNKNIMDAKRSDSAPIAVWPCRLKIIAVFAKRDPIIVGCDILEGTLRVGTPICVVKTDPQTKKRTTIALGKVTSLEINHKPMQVIKKEQGGGGVAVKIEHAVYQNAMTYGRQFDDKDELISQVSRQSIDVLKEVFRTEVSNDEWVLIKQLKRELDIP